MASLDDIRHALELARKGGFNEVELEVDGVSFTAKLDGVAASIGVAPAAPVVEAVDEEPAERYADIGASCVGYFQPSKKAVGIGDVVEKGQTVAAIQALGLANEVMSNVNGEVVETLAQPGQAVQFGQPLFRVRVTG